MTFEMKLYRNAFLAIAFGAKTVEMRLFDNKRRQIKVGDIIDFSDVVTAQKLSCEVIDIAVYDNFEQLYECYDKVSLGYDSDETALASDMLEYYSQIDIDRYGVVAITIKSSNVIN